jgi:hypothetical protein
MAYAHVLATVIGLARFRAAARTHAGVVRGSHDPQRATGIKNLAATIAAMRGLS